MEPLAPHDREQLTRLIELREDLQALAAHSSTPLLDLYAWVSRPDIQAYLAFHRAHHHYLQQRDAREALHAMVAADDPIERRRAACTLLKAPVTPRAARRDDPAPPAAPVPGTRPTSSRDTAHGGVPSSTAPASTAPAVPAAITLASTLGLERPAAAGNSFPATPTATLLQVLDRLEAQARAELAQAQRDLMKASGKLQTTLGDAPISQVLAFQGLQNPQESAFPAPGQGPTDSPPCPDPASG